MCEEKRRNQGSALKDLGKSMHLVEVVERKS